MLYTKRKLDNDYIRSVQNIKFLHNIIMLYYILVYIL